MASTAVVAAKPTFRSRVANGSAVLPRVDGRSLVARRFRELTTALMADLGADASEALKLQVRTAAAAQVQVEDLTARMARGEPVSPEELSRATNGAMRALEAVKRSRVQAPRRVASRRHPLMAAE